MVVLHAWWLFSKKIWICEATTFSSKNVTYDDARLGQARCVDSILLFFGAGYSYWICMELFIVLCISLRKFVSNCNLVRLANMPVIHICTNVHLPKFFLFFKIHFTLSNLSYLAIFYAFCSLFLQCVLTWYVLLLKMNTSLGYLTDWMQQTLMIQKPSLLLFLHYIAQYKNCWSTNTKMYISISYVNDMYSF